MRTAVGTVRFEGAQRLRPGLSGGVSTLPSFRSGTGLQWATNLRPMGLSAVQVSAVQVSAVQFSAVQFSVR